MSEIKEIKRVYVPGNTIPRLDVTGEIKEIKRLYFVDNITPTPPLDVRKSIENLINSFNEGLNDDDIKIIELKSTLVCNVLIDVKPAKFDMVESLRVNFPELHITKNLD
jgi:hypothetical protein